MYSIACVAGTDPEIYWWWGEDRVREQEEAGLLKGGKSREGNFFLLLNVNSLHVCIKKAFSFVNPTIGWTDWHIDNINCGMFILPIKRGV